MKEIGKIAHYYPKIEVAVVELSDELKIGDKIGIEGSTTSFSQLVDSMEIEHQRAEVAKQGQSIGLKVKERVREGDKVYKLE